MTINKRRFRCSRFRTWNSRRSWIFLKFFRGRVKGRERKFFCRRMWFSSWSCGKWRKMLVIPMRFWKRMKFDAFISFTNFIYKNLTFSLFFKFLKYFWIKINFVIISIVDFSHNIVELKFNSGIIGKMFLDFWQLAKSLVVTGQIGITLPYFALGNPPSDF
jgi:hypothetical protein